MELWIYSKGPNPVVAKIYLSSQKVESGGEKTMSMGKINYYYMFT